MAAGNKYYSKHLHYYFAVLRDWAGEGEVNIHWIMEYSAAPADAGVTLSPAFL